MGTTTVYRVEDAEGLGPYKFRDDTALETMYSAHADSPYHPQPEDDGVNILDIADKSFFYAFTSLDQLAEWFAGYGEELAQCGYFISEYAVPSNHTVHGSRQVLFRKVYAAFRNTFPAQCLDNRCR